LEFGNVGFGGERKTGVPGEKPLGAEKRTNNKLNPRMTPSPGIEPGTHWWEASALISYPLSSFPLWEIGWGGRGSSGMQLEPPSKSFFRATMQSC